MVIFTSSRLLSLKSQALFKCLHEVDVTITVEESKIERKSTTLQATNQKKKSIRIIEEAHWDQPVHNDMIRSDASAKLVKHVITHA